MDQFQTNKDKIQFNHNFSSMYTTQMIVHLIIIHFKELCCNE
jgi:hypothetical protein